MSGAPFGLFLEAIVCASVGGILAGCASASSPPEPTGTQTSADTSLCPAGTFPQGVDTSSGQGTITWSSAKTAGVDFAVMKATQSTDYSDPGFPSNWAPAKAAGVVRGAYHFFDPTVDGVAQAQYFLAAMGPLDAEDLSPMLDVECPTGASDCLGYAGGSGDEPAATFRQHLLDWMNTVEAATGRKPILYTYGSFFSGTGADGTGTDVDTTGFDVYPLWIADYSGTACFTAPSPWTVAAIWQYDDNGTFSGISGQVDVDHMIGPIDELLGWPTIVHTSSADVNGDGKADVCGRDATGVTCALATTAGAFGTPFAGPAWSDANGWMPPRYASTVQLADVNGDGMADVCGRAVPGLTCTLSTGTGFGATVGGPAWSDAEGWELPQYYATIQLADINGDGKADACARAGAGIVCALAGQGSGDAGSGAADDAGASTGPSYFGAQIDGPAWSDTAGWNVPNRYRTIRFPDIDGDGKADVCGRSSDGLHCALSTGAGFGVEFTGPAWSDASGWSAAAYAATIQFADVNGDGKSDVCARGAAGITCAVSQGGAFAAPFAGPAWSDAAGWNAPQYYATITLLDIDGDGMADVCGRGPNGMTCALSTGTGFGTAFAGPAWTDAAGWNQPHYYGTIRAGDVDGDGKDDLCARGAAGVTCALSTGTGFGAEVAGPAWSDPIDAGSASETWGVAPYWATVTTVGGRGRALGGSRDGGVAGSADGGIGEPPPIDTEDASSGGGASLKASAEGSASAACSCRVAGLDAGESGATAAGLLVFSGILAVARRRRRRYPDA